MNFNHNEDSVIISPSNFSYYIDGCFLLLESQAEFLMKETGLTLINYSDYEKNQIEYLEHKNYLLKKESTSKIKKRIQKSFTKNQLIDEVNCLLDDLNKEIKLFNTCLIGRVVNRQIFSKIKGFFNENYFIEPPSDGIILQKENPLDTLRKKIGKEINSKDEYFRSYFIERLFSERVFHNKGFINECEFDLTKLNRFELRILYRKIKEYECGFKKQKKVNEDLVRNNFNNSNIIVGLKRNYNENIFTRGMIVDEDNDDDES